MIDQGRGARDEDPVGIDPFGRAPGPGSPVGVTRRPHTDRTRPPHTDRTRPPHTDRPRRPHTDLPRRHPDVLPRDPSTASQAFAGLPWAPDAGPAVGPAAPSAPGPVPWSHDPSGIGPAPWSPGAPVPSRRPTWALLLMAVTAGLLMAGAIVAGERMLPGRSVADESLDVPVPAGWQRVIAAPGSTAGGVSLAGVATTGGYTCQGRRHSRATVGHSFVVRGDGATARTEDGARDFGLMFARSFYGAEAGPGPVTPITVGDRTGAVSEVRVAPADGCAVAGSVTVVALPTDRRGPQGADGVLLLVLQRDIRAGADGPALVTEQAAGALLDTVQVVPHPTAAGG